MIVKLQKPNLKANQIDLNNIIYNGILFMLDQPIYIKFNIFIPLLT